MVDEISLIGWRDDVGAFLIMQYPRKLQLNTQDIMQIYTAHRQNTLYPNFATINYKGKKIASFFSGLKTTEYKGAPNLIVSVFLDQSEPFSIFRNILPEISEQLLIKLFNRLPQVLEELEDVLAVMILHIDGYPVLEYPENLKISSKLKSEILSAHFGTTQTVKECIFEVEGEFFASFFTGKKEEKYVIIPNYIVTFILKSEKSGRLKRKLSKYARKVLYEIEKVTAEGLEQINDKTLELLIDDELSDKPIFDEKDFEQISASVEEPEVVTEDGRSLEQMLERIKMKAEEKVQEIETFEEIETELEAEIEEDSFTEEELVTQIKDLREKLKIQENLLKEKDQNIKQLTLIIKSLRKYVSY